MPHVLNRQTRRQRTAIAVGDAVDIVLRVNLRRANLQFDPLKLFGINAASQKVGKCLIKGSFTVLQTDALGGTMIMRKVVSSSDSTMNTTRQYRSPIWCQTAAFRSDTTWCRHPVSR